MLFLIMFSQELECFFPSWTSKRCFLQFLFSFPCRKRFVQLLESPLLEITLAGAWKLSGEPGQKFPESGQTKNGNLIPEETFGRPGMLLQKLMKCRESVQTVQWKIMIPAHDWIWDHYLSLSWSLGEIQVFPFICL